MNANKMTTEFFKKLLPFCNFKLLGNNDRHMYAGASEFCLIANFTASDERCFDILTEGGRFQVFGYDNSDVWCVEFAENGDREQLF